MSCVAPNAAPAACPLTQAHRDYFTARAVPIPLALLAGCQSVDGATGSQLLSFDRPLAFTALAFPYRDQSPWYWRLRPDGGDARYLAPGGRDVPPYLPPAFDKNGTTQFCVCESPTKALSLTACGLQAVGLGGTGTTLATGTTDRELNTCWSTTRVSGRQVTIVFDANRATNANVARDEARLAIALTRAGAKVFVAKLPPGPNGEGWGPDDFVARHGTGALHAVVAAAEPADPVDLITAVLVEKNQNVRVARVLDVLDHKPFGVAVLERGFKADQHLRRLLKKDGLGPALRAALDNARAWLRSATADACKGPAPYVIEGGRLHVVQSGTEGGELAVIADFVARIEREIVLDDGAERQTTFEISGTSATGQDFPLIRVSPSEFMKEPWAVTRWGAGAIVRPLARVRDLLAAAIQTVSEPERGFAYSHLGWREHDGRLVYLHAGGAVGAREVDVVLDERLARYRLPDRPEDLVAATRAALDLRRVAADELGLLLLALIFRAPLQHFLYADVAAWIHGRTGSLKSTIAALAMAFFGDFERETLPGSWESTPTALENLIFSAKDALVVIDDFAPTSAESFDKMRTAAAAILRAVGNQSSRGRSRADLTLRPNRPPRGLVIGTGEDLPNGESVLARLFPIAIQCEAIDLAELTKAQANAPSFKHVMFAFVDYVRVKAPALQASLKVRYEAYRALAQQLSSHLRAPAAVAHFMLGAEVFAEFVQSIGVFTAVEATDFVEATFNAFIKTAHAHAGHSIEANPARRFIAVLRSLVLRCEAYLTPKAPGAHAAGAGSGTIGALQQFLIADAQRDAEAERRKPGRRHVGWYDDAYVYLDPEGAHEAVVQALKAGGQTMPVKPRTLWARLDELGVLVTEEADRKTVRRVVNGVKTTVLQVPWAALDDEPDPSPAHPIGSATPEPEPATPTRGPAGASSGPALRRDSRNTPVRVEGVSTSTVRPAWEPLPTPFQPLPAPNGVQSGAAIGKGNQGVALNHPALPVSETYPPMRDDEGASRGILDGSTARLIPPGTGENGDTGEPGGRAARAEHAGAAGFVNSAVTAAVTTEKTGRVAAAWARDGAVGIDGAGQAETLPQAIVDCGEVALLLDTASFPNRQPLVHGAWIALPNGTSSWIPASALEGGPICAALQEVEVVVHDAVRTTGVLSAFGVELAGVFDVNVAAVLLDGGRRLDGGVVHDVSALARQFGVETARLGPANVLAALAAELRERAAVAGLERVLCLEHAIVPALVHMDRAGVLVDPAALDAAINEFSVEVASLEARLRAQLGIDVLTPGEIIPALKLVGIDVPRTGKDVLARHLDSPIVRDLVELQCKRAFLNDLGPKLRNAVASSPDGRVRPQVNALGAVTGRLSYQSPNLQGLPRDPRIRRGIRPAPGNVFVIGDYKAIELRVAAHVTGDGELCRIFAEGGDPHRSMAARMTGKAAQDVTDSEREGAKPINFGALFGVKPDGLAKLALLQYGIVLPRADASRALKEYRELFAGVTAWQQRIDGAWESVMTNETGRRRVFTQGDALTKRLNFPIQSLAADGIKRAMAHLLPDLRRFDASLVLTVHDELVLECVAAAAPELATALEQRMVEGMSAVIGSVEVEVDVRIQGDWTKSNKSKDK